MKMKMKIDDFRVHEGASVKLKKWATMVKPYYSSEEKYQKMLSDHVDQLSRLQELHYASNTKAVLLIFQGMDGAGKDGVIKHVMSGVNPQGCQVYSFKHPSAAELKHDFLWRTTRALPERGKIGIFNRSYYEEVLITRVHPGILKSEGVSDDVRPWKHRFRSIVDLERHLERNDTKIIKFFLHLSRAEQARRFLARIDDPEKNWKLSIDDIKERAYWKDYMTAYEECLGATSTKQSAWHIIPADDKLNARLIVSQIIIEVFQSFKMKYPKTSASRQKELKHIRKQLVTARDTSR